MGLYVNPVDETKEQFLALEGTELTSTPVNHRVDNQLVVCLVQNVVFSAAAVAYSQLELCRFVSPDDIRPRRWFLVPIDRLRPVCPDWRVYAKPGLCTCVACLARPLR